MDYSSYPPDRAAAKAQGAQYYYTGKPCTRGHIALRKTKGACVECMKEDWAIDNQRRSEKPKSAASKAAGRRYYEKNKDLVTARANNRPAEEVRKYKYGYKQRNPELYKVLTSVRKRRHRNATPKWLTKEDKLVIRKLYLEAMKLTKLTGVRYVVDHKYPLISDEVCGLHVPNNLQIMTQDENLRKSNKLLDYEFVPSPSTVL